MRCIERGAESGNSAVCKPCAETLERIRKLIQAYFALGFPRATTAERR